MRPLHQKKHFSLGGRLYEALYCAYFNLGHIQLREGKHSVALRCLAQARDCARNLKGKGMKSGCCGSMAQVGAYWGAQELFPGVGCPPLCHPGPAEFGGFCSRQALAEASLRAGLAAALAARPRLLEPLLQ
ncbi:tonsoku-like protein isoform X1 [Strix aluco]|uniref:tonsoku-like protein isoform X1 n=1 Tax=Strix aluco TaxID=111821 RepID=UPI003DA44679